MRIHDKLDEILKHGSKIKVLRFLFNEKDEHTGRTIARGIGMSPSSTHKTLQDMKKEGLINAKRKGNAILYKLQEDNYVVKKLLQPLFEKEKSIYSDIILLIKKHLLNAKSDIVLIAVFGSVIRKEETSRSDMDILILLKKKSGKRILNKLLSKMHVEMVKKFGLAIAPYVMTKSEIKQKYSKKLPIIKSILDNNELIYGEPIERVLA